MTRNSFPRYATPPPQVVTGNLTWVVLATYYAFLFSIPFQTVDIGLAGLATISRLIGYLFMVTTFLKPRLCYKRPTAAFYCFAIYLVIFSSAGLFAVLTEQLTFDWGQLQTLIQLLIFFTVSCSLLSQSDRILRRALLTFAASCIVLAVAMALGFASDPAMEGRVTALDENPNAIADVLVFGILALTGLAYGRGQVSRRARAYFWLFSAFMFLAVIRTGSRGAILALLIGFLVFTLKRARINYRLKVGVVIVLAAVFVVIVSNSIESVSERWQKTFEEGDTSGRDQIYDQGWQMFLEKPVYGWGIGHQRELGSRLGLPTRDFHNLYLHVLTQVGLIGAVPFFLGLLFCCVSAWKARKTVQGILPTAMILSLLAISAKGTTMTDKSLWLVLAYVTAAGTYPLVAFGKRRTLQRGFAALPKYPATVASPPAYRRQPVYGPRGRSR
jgi:O-antigen ligase